MTRRILFLFIVAVQILATLYFALGTLTSIVTRHDVLTTLGLLGWMLLGADNVRWLLRELRDADADDDDDLEE